MVPESDSGSDFNPDTFKFQSSPLIQGTPLPLYNVMQLNIMRKQAKLQERKTVKLQMVKLYSVMSVIKQVLVSILLQSCIARIINNSGMYMYQPHLQIIDLICI